MQGLWTTPWWHRSASTSPQSVGSMLTSEAKPRHATTVTDEITELSSSQTKMCSRASGRVRCEISHTPAHRASTVQGLADYSVVQARMQETRPQRRAARHKPTPAAH